MRSKTISLPDALFEEYDCAFLNILHLDCSIPEEAPLMLCMYSYIVLECRCYMGLFPEIERAWITVDHRLFLWDYQDGYASLLA